MSTISLKCDCGTVQGTAVNITPKSGNRVACCCSDCQAFADYLDRRPQTLDQHGGTEIYQTSQSQVKIHAGLDQVKSMKLSPKGLLRWYASCCYTPIGNTMSSGLPFMGIIHTFTDIQDRDKTLGPVRAYCQTQHAIGTVTHPKAHKKFPLGITGRILRQLITWKVQGKNTPSAFYDAEGKPVSEPVIAAREVH